MVSYSTNIEFQPSEANHLIGLVAISPLVGAVGLWLLRDRPARLHWAVSVGAALLPLLGLTALGFNLPLDFSFSTWRPVSLFQADLLLRLDSISWPLALAAATMSLSIFLCGPSRPESTNPTTRTLVMLYTGLAVIGIMAANAPTVIMAWVAADLISFLMLLATADNEQTVQGGYRRFFSHLASALFVLAGSLPIEWAAYTDWVQQAFWLGAIAFRLGLWPLHVAMPHMPGVRSGLGVVLRLLPPLMGMAFLARFSAGSIPMVLSGWLLLAAALSVVFGGLRWAVSSDPISARPFFVLTLAGMAIAAAAGPQESEVVVVGLASVMALVGTVISQIEIYQPWHRYLAGAAVLLSAGAPYTLGHAGHFSVSLDLAQGFRMHLVAGLVALGFSALILGATRNVSKSPREWDSGESFVRNAYGAGLLLPMVILPLAGLHLRYWPGAASLLSLLFAVLLAGVGWFGLSRLAPSIRGLLEAGTQVLNEGVEGPVAEGFWILLSTASAGLRWLGAFIEGKAAVLWIYVVLLVIALLAAGGGG